MIEAKFLFIILINILILIYHRIIFNIIGIYDYSDNKRKIHSGSISLSGGLILLFNFFFIFLFFNNNLFDLVQIYFLLLFSSLFFLIGFFDDKKNISPIFRIILNSIFIFIFLFFNQEFEIKTLNSQIFDKQIYLNHLSLIFSIFCYIAFLNALNMYDGINGQSGLYLFFVFTYFFYLTQNILFLGICISIIFFLILNFKNKCFLGNSGVNFISFIIFLFVIKLYQTSNIIYVEEILIIMILPGIEMIRLFFYRIMKQKSPFVADNEHIHHLLLQKLNKNKVVLVTSFMSILPLLSFKIVNISSLTIIFFISFYFLVIVFCKVKN